MVMVAWLPVAIVGIICILIVIKVLDLLWWKPRKLEEYFAKQGIRGPSYFFFIGCVKEMVALMVEASSKPMIPQNSHNILPRVLAFYNHWRKIYGNIFLIWFGPTARLAVGEPELVREILLSRSEFFERYEAHPMIRKLEGEGLVSLRGDKWVHHRKVLAPTFHMENLKMLLPLIGKTVVKMLDNLPVSGGEVEIDVSQWFENVTEDAITRTAFGRSYDEGQRVFKLQTQHMHFAAEAFRNVFIPGYRFLPTRKNTSSWKLEKEIRRSLVRLIGRRKADEELEIEKKRQEDGNAKDLLGLMINSSSSSAASASMMRLEDIVEECKTFFFAGKQTTTNMLTWMTVLLAMHPEWQDRAREEVLQVCGSQDVPTRDHLSKLKTLGWIVNETLRLYPPAVATIRRTLVDVELGGHRIPGGTELLIPIMALHHDSRFWGPDVAQFNPARFAEGIGKATRHPTAFIPFGLGPRMCIGQNLAVLEAKLTMAIILQRFSLRLSPSYVHAPTVLMLLYPQYGAPILFRSLSQEQ